MQGSRFGGIKPPYSTETHMVYPLLKDISQKNIDSLTRQLYQSKPVGEGDNGKAYLVSSPFEDIKENVVVKVHKGLQARQKDDLQEVKSLDMLEDLWKEKSLGLSQRGLVAFKPKGGLQHIVSTFVPGTLQDINYNPITPKALHRCVEHIITLDQGTPKHGRFLHRDFHDLGNVHVSSNNAGFFDWENLCTIPIKKNVFIGMRRKPGYEKYHDYINHVRPWFKGSWYVLFGTADTFPFENNLKHFESRVISPYLSKLIQAGKKQEGRSFFQQYLQEKAFYHLTMQGYYSNLAKKIEQNTPAADADNMKYFRIIQKIASSEGVHAKLLTSENTKTPKDILKAELFKMQLAYYAWYLRDCSSLGDFNGKQIGELFDRSKSYFQERSSLAKWNQDLDRKRYYQNCLMIIQVLDKEFNLPRPMVKPVLTEAGQVYFPPIRAMKPDGPRDLNLEEQLYGIKSE
jgi:hypothetical protein